MISGTWINRHNNILGRKGIVPCLAQSAMDRDGVDFIKTTQGIVQSTVLRKSIDILAGQIPLGCADKWPAINQTIIDDIPVETNVDSQYIVAIRSPDAWFVSNMVNKMLLNSTEKSALLDMSTIVAVIRAEVQANLAMDLYHEVYTRYLITPSQISWIQKEGADLDHEKRVDVALANLKGKNVVVVISEQLEKSLKMIQYLIDGKKELKAAFQQAEDLIRSKADNLPAPSTDLILEELKKDSDFYKDLEEYLKHEQRIYSEATKMHSSQLKWMKRRRLVRG
jgi:hypothetical protein